MNSFGKLMITKGLRTTARNLDIYCIICGEKIHHKKGLISKQDYDYFQTKGRTHFAHKACSRKDGKNK